MAIRVMLAEDHQILREGLHRILAAEFEVVGDVGDGLEAIELARQKRPDVAVLDLDMPRLNGIDTARSIMAEVPRTRCLLLTMHIDRQHVLEAVRAGIRGYVIKTQAASELIQAIRVVADNQTYLSTSISGMVAEACRSPDAAASDPLTVRERMVLQLVAEGQSTKQVAHTLGISVKTAETHRTKIMAKLDIHDTATLVRYAIRVGVIRA